MTTALEDNSTFNVFLEAAPDAIVIVDSEGRITTVNKLAETMFGYEHFEIVGRKVEMLIPERFQEKHVESRKEYFRFPRTRTMGEGRELVGRRKNGAEFSVEVSLSPLQVEDDTFTMSIIRDVSLRKQMELKFRGLLESAPDGIVVVDTDGVIVMVNSKTEDLFGHNRQELIGRPVEILVPDGVKSRHVFYREQYTLYPQTRPMGAGRTLRGRRKDASEFPVEISLSPLETEQGVLITSIIRDVTQRVQLEAKIKGLLESAPDGIVVVDANGLIVIVNSQTEQLFGYSRSELLGRPVEILVPDAIKERHVEYRQNYTHNPKTRPMGAGMALTGRRKDGSELPVEISLSPLETEEGTLVTSIIRDITDRRRAEEQIQASLREKEALLKEIHHRVKNNLQVTSSLLRLQSESVVDDHVRELFAEGQNRIRSMALVHEKLYRSRDLSKINFTEYIEELVQLLFRSYGVDSGQFRLRMSREKVHLSIESAVSCGLLVNELISNVLKHAFVGRSEGEIVVELRAEGKGRFQVIVRDNGCGLPPDFDLQKVESLGLQIVRTITKQLNGTVMVTSEYNEGTAFKIDFHEIQS